MDQRELDCVARGFEASAEIVQEWKGLSRQDMYTLHKKYLWQTNASINDTILMCRELENKLRKRNNVKR